MAILMGALESQAVASQVACRQDIGPQQLAGRLREARKAVGASPVSFVPVIVEAL